jgi:N-acyl-D-amino-acid deacylase
MSVRVLSALLAFTLACTPSSPVGTRPAPVTGPFDVVIENGRIVDGTGAAWFYGDLAIRGDRIAAIGPRGAFRSAHAPRSASTPPAIVVAPASSTSRRTPSATT